MEITQQSQNISVSSHEGTWRTIDVTTQDGKEYFLMEHEEYGDDIQNIILNQSGELILENVSNGFSDLEDFLSEQNQIVGIIEYKHSAQVWGEDVEYTDSKEFIADYKKALNTMGPKGAEAHVLTSDIETNFQISEIREGEFDRTVNRDIYYLLAQNYGFKQAWPGDVIWSSTYEEWEMYGLGDGYYSYVEKLIADRKNSQRLFVDMDGTLAKFKQVDRLETMYEKGYFANLQPMESVVQAIKYISSEYPEIEIFCLSSYPAGHALTEKKQWIENEIPEISNRIFVPFGSDKTNYIPEGVRPNDVLLDDYTSNLQQWSQWSGKGIQLLNGINHTEGAWQGNRIWYDKPFKELAKNIVSIIKGEAQVYDIVPAYIENQAFLAGQQCAKEIFAAGYEPYYTNGQLHIFRNSQTDDLQYYKLTYQPQNNGQSEKLNFQKLETPQDLATIQHLLPDSLRINYEKGVTSQSNLRYIERQL